MNGTPSWLASGHGDTPLILLHGIGWTAEIWLPQLNHFGRSRLTVAWTQPGFAYSPPPPQQGWKELADALESMLQAQGIGKAHILGHSMGGMVAQEFYHRYPHRVASLILSSTSGAFGSSDPQWKEEFIRQRTEALRPFTTLAQATPSLMEPLVGPNISTAMLDLANMAARDIEMQEYLTAMQLLVTFNRKADLKAIAAPTLLLAGELDAQAPPKGIKRMAEQIPNAQYHEFPGLQHMASLEAPDAYNQAIENFLSALP